MNSTEVIGDPTDGRSTIAGESRYIVPTYARPDLVLSHGRGVYLFDTQGKRYLDFTAGIAVNALGHADPDWVAAVSEQAGLLTHVSNLYHTAPQVELARQLVENSFADRVYFCNSGSEANETALKFARKVARKEFSGQNDKHSGSRMAEFAKVKVVAFSGSFHGRTMGALAATYKAKYRDPFAPLVPGFQFLPFNDLEAASAAIDEDVCAVIVEPIQGEGGVNPAEPSFLRGLRALCDRAGALLIFDEVQCGLGRSGTLWAHQAYGVSPDAMTLAKPLAGGLPIGAVLVTERVGTTMGVGDHGSTFGGGPLVCRAAQVVFERINQPDFLAHVKETGLYLMDSLMGLVDISDEVLAVRGRGLLIGLELSTPVAPIITAARERGLLIINAGERVIRLCPPLIVKREQIETAVGILGEALHAGKDLHT